MLKHPETAGSWIEYAQEDLLSAGSLIRDELFRTACFHAQQAAEKMLKAVLAGNGLKVPRKHDLGFLADLLGKKIPELADMRIDLEWLVIFAVDMRYPFSGIPVTRNDAERALAIAERIKLICEHHLQQHE